MTYFVTENAGRGVISEEQRNKCKKEYTKKLG